jgi:hypothetical protein
MLKRRGWVTSPMKISESLLGGLWKEKCERGLIFSIPSGDGERSFPDFFF